MTYEERALARFKHEYAATSHRFEENGDLTLTSTVGRKTQRRRVKADVFSNVVNCLKAGDEPLGYQMRAELLGVKPKPRQKKPDPGKR